MYAFLISVTSADNRPQVQALADALAGFAVPDPGGAGYLLAYQGAPVQEGTDPKTGDARFTRVEAIAGFNQDVPQAVLGVLAAASPYCREITYNPPKVRADIDAELLRYAGYDGCTRVWALHPGDPTAVTSAADLTSRFTPLP